MSRPYGSGLGGVGRGMPCGPKPPLDGRLSLGLSFAHQQPPIRARGRGVPMGVQSVQIPPNTQKTPRMLYLRSLSRIESRFATTLVCSRFVNEDEKSAEATFTVTLPQAAFISHFTMCVDGKTIVGEVKEKEKAKVQYERAKERGESAGHIAQAPRETNVFHICANIAAGGEATFNLDYQEILQRVHGAYKHVINIKPQQAVDDMKVDVFIKESQRIKTIKVAKFGQKVGERTNVELLVGEDEKNASIDISDQSTAAHIAYVPTVEDKQIDGQFVVLYDVERQENGGELQVVNGYFVHFFSPSGLPAAPKHVIFALDKSGSMSGRKIQQTKDAMSKILNDLNSEDRFNILTFNNCVDAWKPESVRATPAAVEAAIRDVEKINAYGATNIHQVLEDSLIQVFKNADSNSMNNCMVILLTDGQPNTGQCSTDAIVGLTKKLNKNLKVSIQCIGFGGDADFDLLKKIAMENEGLARRVYEDSDAALQLQGFYAEISQLLLTDLNVKYLDERVQPDSIIQDSNRRLYEGGEFVVVGKLTQNEVIGDGQVDSLKAQIDCMGFGGQKKYRCGCIPPLRFPFLDAFKPSSTVPLPTESVGGFVERMWAYLSIKQLLDKAKYAASGIESQQIKQRALQLSLKYQFVTSLTSMVVTQPDKQMECGLEEFGFEDQFSRMAFGGGGFGGVGYSGRAMLLAPGCGGAGGGGFGGPPRGYGGGGFGSTGGFGGGGGYSGGFGGGGGYGGGFGGGGGYSGGFCGGGGYGGGGFGQNGRESSTPTFGRTPAAPTTQTDGVPQTQNGHSEFSSLKSRSGEAPQMKIEEKTDMNDSLAGMPLSQVVQLDWKAVLPLLTASTINSLPLATLSAIPWDDVIMFIPDVVFGCLSECVLQSFPNTAWRKVTIEQINQLAVDVLIALPINTIKYIPKQHWKQIKKEKMNAMPQEAKKIVAIALNE